MAVHLGKETGQEKLALYRPKAEYVGQYCGLMGCKFNPLEQRKGSDTLEQKKINLSNFSETGCAPQVP